MPFYTCEIFTRGGWYSSRSCPYIASVHCCTHVCTVSHGEVWLVFNCAVRHRSRASVQYKTICCWLLSWLVRTCPEHHGRHGHKLPVRQRLACAWIFTPQQLRRHRVVIVADGPTCAHLQSTCQVRHWMPRRPGSCPGLIPWNSSNVKARDQEVIATAEHQSDNSCSVALIVLADSQHQDFCPMPAGDCQMRGPPNDDDVVHAQRKGCISFYLLSKTATVPRTWRGNIKLAGMQMTASCPSV